MKRPADTHLTEPHKFNKIPEDRAPWTHTDWSSGAYDAPAWTAPEDQVQAVVPPVDTNMQGADGSVHMHDGTDVDMEDGQADTDAAAVVDAAAVEDADANPADGEPSSASGRWSKRYRNHDDGSFSYKWSFVKPKANAANSN